MIFVALLDQFLNAWGLAYLATSLWKIAKGYPVKRWFF